MFFDFHIHGNPKLAIEAQIMGYHGVALVIPSRDSHSTNSKRYSSKDSRRNLKDSKRFSSKDSKTPSSNGSKISSSNDFRSQFEILKDLKEAARELEETHQLLVQTGVEILSKNPTDLKKQVQKFRKRSDIILVHGGDLKINRAATEDPRVDILCHPYHSRHDAGINHVLATKAAENSVAIELNLKYYLLTRTNQRYRVLSQFRSISKLSGKYNCPVIITSGAGSFYELRNPQDIMALARCFGMDKEEAHNALSIVPHEIMERNKIRDQVITPGVRTIKE